MSNFLKILITANLFLSQTLCAEQLLKSTSSWDGGRIAYPTGDAEITSERLSIKAGTTTPFHCHPVPTLGYILKGSVEVETKDGKKFLVKEGESVVEIMRTVHRGKAIDGAVEIIVFFTGSTSMPNTVFPENDPNNIYCDD